MVAKSPNSRCRSMAEVSTKISNCMRPRLPWRIVHALGGSRKNAKLPNRVTRKDQTIGMSSSSIPRRFFNTVSSPEALPKPRTGFKPTCGYVTPGEFDAVTGFLKPVLRNSGIFSMASRRCHSEEIGMSIKTIVLVIATTVVMSSGQTNATIWWTGDLGDGGWQNRGNWRHKKPAA